MAGVNPCGSETTVHHRPIRSLGVPGGPQYDLKMATAVDSNASETVGTGAVGPRRQSTRAWSRLAP